jgi:hypothetical protein
MLSSLHDARRDASSDHVITLTTSLARDGFARLPKYPEYLGIKIHRAFISARVALPEPSRFDGIKAGSLAFI